jgi:DNA-binding GntR family transcriptional regulator
MPCQVTLCRVGIDPSAPEYVYQQLASIIREQIQSGELLPRARLPTLVDLVDKYNVAPMTARRAIAMLVDEGLVVTYPGRGTYVR